MVSRAYPLRSDPQGFLNRGFKQPGIIDTLRLCSFFKPTGYSNRGFFPAIFKEVADLRSESIMCLHYGQTLNILDESDSTYEVRNPANLNSKSDII
jgi:hypothetical protein